VLKDLRPVGWLAVVAIWIQVVTNVTTIALVKTPDNLTTLVLAQILTGLFAAACFLVWYFRAAFNMFRVYPHAPIRPVWGVCCYIVPIANLICPYLEMRKLVRWTFAGRRRGTLEAVTAIWWFSFLVRIFINRVAMHDEARLVWALVSVVAAALVTVLIVRISRRQASFRWGDSQEDARVEMLPLSQRGRLPARKGEAIPGSEIEDGWGRH
jgi:hypothetical protein